MRIRQRLSHQLADRLLPLLLALQHGQRCPAYDQRIVSIELVLAQ